MAEKTRKFETSAQVLKVDESLGLVLGFAIICKENGEDYHDLQGDHISEQDMIEAATDFMLNSRAAGDMHRGDDGNITSGDKVAKRGQIVFAFPLTTDIAKAFEIETARTGLMIALKPDSDDILQKFRDGTYTGFSISGKAKRQEVEHA